MSLATSEDDHDNFDQERYLNRIFSSIVHEIKPEEELDPRLFMKLDLTKVPRELAEKIKQYEDGLDDQEKECFDTLWKKEKVKQLTNRGLLRELVASMKNNPDFNAEFLKSLHMPGKLKQEHVD